MFNRYLEIKKEIKKLQDEKLELEKQIYLKFKNDLDEVEEGTKSFKDGNYKIKVIKKLTYSVDESLASTMPEYFRIKYAFDKKKYNTLNDEQKKMVDECLTTKSAKPSFSVEEE